ncbi:MAG: hypothetical protein U9Q81_21930 [Pseudomonadota bacterium]|nr:hypothetical protein [Pseudomonadota bacterium]
MNKTLISLSVASAIALTSAMPAYAEDEIECDGVLVQSRLALANCMIESAVAIAAGINAAGGGCQAGEWDIEAVVPEFVEQTIPIQGSLAVRSENEEEFSLTGQSSAQQQNNVNCQVATTDAANSFDGVPFSYSAGRGNGYPDAIIDRDEHLLCITTSLSAGNITIEGPPRARLAERNRLTFSEDEVGIGADGWLAIGLRKGQEELDISVWDMAEGIVMPPLDQVQEDGFALMAETDDLGGCKIEVEAGVENLEFPTGEETGGLTIFGTLKVEASD